MGGVLWTLEGAGEGRQGVLHEIYRDEPLNWVLHQESSRIEANLDRAWGTERQISSSQVMAGQGHKQQGAGTGHTLASFLSLEFQNEESVQQQRH